MPEPGQFGKAEASVASGSIGPNSGVSASDVLGGAGRPDRSEPGQRANLASAQYFAEQGITATNPYGKQGFFSKHFGIDPANISYANIMSPTQMAGIAALSYDRYQNPYAATNVLGKATGAQPAFGVVRSGLKPGDITRLGTVQAYRQNLGLLDRLAAGVGTLAGAGYAIDKGTQVMGLEDSAPIDPNTGMSLSPTSGGIMDVLTGGQAGFIGEKTGNMVDSMMNFFSGEQQSADIQSTDVAPEMSAYTEAGRPASGVPQLGPNYGSPMAQITAPATTKSYSSTPDRADMMAFNFSPTASSQVAVEPGQAMSPSSNLTTTKAQEQAIAASRQAASLSNAPTISLELSYSEASPAEQAMIAAELQQRASKGDEYAGSLVEVLGPSGVPVPPPRPVKFSGSVDQPLNLIPSSLDILGNPAL